MTEGAIKWAQKLYRQNKIHGIIALGGNAFELFARVLQKNLSTQNHLKLLQHHINDSEFSHAIIEAFNYVCRAE